MVGGVEGCALLLSGNVELRSSVELAVAIGLAGLLHEAESLEVLVAAAVEATLLQVEVADLLFVAEEAVEAEIAVVLTLALLNDFVETFGFEGHDEVGDAAETPVGVGNGLHQDGLALGGGAELVAIAGQVVVVEVEVVAR